MDSRKVLMSCSNSKLFFFFFKWSFEDILQNMNGDESCKYSKCFYSCSSQEPPLDWEPPAKIPRVSRNRPNAMSPGNAVYHAAMSGLKQNQVGPAAIGAGGPQIMPKMMTLAQGNAAAAAMSQALMNRQRGRPLGVNTTPGNACDLETSLSWHFLEPCHPTLHDEIPATPKIALIYPLYLPNTNIKIFLSSLSCYPKNDFEIIPLP